MSINIRRYVDVQSGVGAGATVAQRELIGRLFVDNPKVPADAIVEFDEASDVATYFGGSSPEYLRAVTYFGFVSKSLTRPRRLGFARWAKVANEARIYGARVTASVADFEAISAGEITLNVGGQVGAVTALDLTGVVSYAAVATALQTAIRALAGDQYAATSTVTYDPVTGAFVFTSAQEEAAAISVTDAGDLGDLLGWTTGAVFSPGVDSTPIADALAASVNVSNNFGAFAFVDALTTDEVEDASAWNAAQNVAFMFTARTSAADAAALSAATLGNSGTALTLATVAGEFDELLPMSILAATAYERRNSVQNYMFQSANLTPKVTTDAAADLYDALRVNYYGNTQTAGQQINFYQRGVLMGTDTAPVDMNTYANEMWLKDAAQSAVMALLLALPRIPANVQGRSQVLAALQDPIDRALTNGVISVGKALSVPQRVFVTEVTADPLAWQQVQSIGYWLDAVVEPFTGAGGTTEFRIVYTLVYSKDDAVRKVEGQHVLV